MSRRWSRCQTAIINYIMTQKGCNYVDSQVWVNLCRLALDDQSQKAQDLD